MNSFRVITHKRSSSGAALVEFAIVLPVLLFVLVGIVNIGSFLSQIHSISTAVRHGARQAIQHSIENSSPSCSFLTGITENEALKYYFLHTPRPKSRWTLENVSIQTSSDPNVNPAKQIIKITAAAEVQDNCLMCWGNFLRRVLPSLTFSFILKNNCS